MCLGKMFLSFCRLVLLGEHNPQPQSLLGPKGHSMIGIVFVSNFSLTQSKILSLSLILPIAPLVPSKRA